MKRAGAAVAENTNEQVGVSIHQEVYSVSVTRTNIEIDDALIERAMSIYRLRSKREAVDFALRKLVGEPMSREEMLSAEGRGWVGDLDKMRSHDVPEW
ncbi:MAG TPA: type II toxin-antitoxin system VapB family antitoxin [Solirubrobacterales bacterium]